MVDIVFGVNIVEIVTSGLYPNSLDIFREYIQNSCDAIDDAINAGTLQEDEGIIDIDIDKDARRIIFKDNGMGLGTKHFERTMSIISAVPIRLYKPTEAFAESDGLEVWHIAKLWYSARKLRARKKFRR